VNAKGFFVLPLTEGPFAFNPLIVLLIYFS